MKFSRVASIIIILISAVSLYFVHQLRQDRNTQRDEVAKLTTDLDVTIKKHHAAEAKVKELSAALPVVSNRLAKTSAELDNTRKNLEAVTKERETLKETLAATEQKIPPLQQELATAKEALREAEEKITKQATEIAAAAELKKQIESLTTENKTLGTRIEELQADIKRLQAENEDLRKTPVNVRGRVAAVDTRWNFLVLDVGQEQKVRKDAQFSVYRDKKFICKAQVISVNKETSIAEVLPDFRRGEPRVGDMAIH
ncbi:MAG: hypothetical protein N3B01_08200 [Verrucomicrobiae bacterium]|nr:hypothetical protein [Verrucomicrobiae bacterium]